MVSRLWRIHLWPELRILGRYLKFIFKFVFWLRLLCHLGILESNFLINLLSIFSLGLTQLINIIFARSRICLVVSAKGRFVCSRNFTTRSLRPTRTLWATVIHFSVIRIVSYSCLFLFLNQVIALLIIWVLHRPYVLIDILKFGIARSFLRFRILCYLLLVFHLILWFGWVH